MLIWSCFQIFSEVSFYNWKGTHSSSELAAVWCGGGDTFYSPTSSNGVPVRSLCLPVHMWVENDASQSQMFHGLHN